MKFNVNEPRISTAQSQHRLPLTMEGVLSLKALILKFSGVGGGPSQQQMDPELEELKKNLREGPKLSRAVSDRLLGHTQLRDEAKAVLVFRRDVYSVIGLRQFDLLSDVLNYLRTPAAAGKEKREQLAAEMFDVADAEKARQIVDFMLKHPDSLPLLDKKATPQLQPKAKFNKERLLKMFYSQVDPVWIKKNDDCLRQLLLQREVGKKTVKLGGDQLTGNEDSAKEEKTLQQPKPLVRERSLVRTAREKSLIEAAIDTSLVRTAREKSLVQVAEKSPTADTPPVRRRPSLVAKKEEMTLVRVQPKQLKQSTPMTQAERDMLAFCQTVSEDGRVDVTRRETALWHQAPTSQRVAFWQMKDQAKR